MQKFSNFPRCAAFMIFAKPGLLDNAKVLTRLNYKKRADISRKSADMRKKMNKEQQLPFDKEKMHRCQAGLYSASQCCMKLAMNFYLEGRNTAKRRVKLCFVPVLLLFSNLQLLGFSHFLRISALFRLITLW